MGFKFLIWLYTEFTHSTQSQPLYIPNALQTKISPYRAVNTFRLGYTNQSVNVV